MAAIVLSLVGGLAYSMGAFDFATEGDAPEQTGEALNFSVPDQNLEAGGSTVVTVSDREGRPVAGAEVSVNGSVAGETSDNGQAVIQIPETSTVVLEASKDDLTIERTFGTGFEEENGQDDGDQETGDDQDQNDTTGDEEDGENDVSGNETDGSGEENGTVENGTGEDPVDASVSFDLFRPADGGSVGTYNADFNFSVSTNVEASYDLLVDGSIVDIGDLSSGDSYVEASFPMSQEGSHTWSVRVETESGEVFESGQRNFQLDIQEQDSGDEEEPDRVIVFEPEGSFAGYEPEFNFDVNNTIGADSYVLSLDGEDFFSGQLEDGMITVQRQEIVQEQGSHSFTVELLDGSQEIFTSDEYSFSTEESAPPIEISKDSPSNGASVQGHEADFNFTVNSPYEYRLLLYTNGEVRYNSTFHNEQSPGTITRNMQESGDHTWSVEAISLETGETFSTGESEFSTSEGAGFAQIDLVYPEDGASGDPGGEGILFEYDVEAFEPVNYEMVIDGSTVYSSELDEGLHEFSKSRELSDGEHTWFVRVENGSDSLKSEERTLTVE